MDVSKPKSVSVYPLAIVVAVLAGLTVLLNVPPLIWHGKHRNFAPSFLIACILIDNILNFTNAIIWHNDDFETWFAGDGLCDVHVKILMANSTAIPAATLCILKKLADVMNTSKICLVPTTAERRRSIIFEILICLGIPLVTMILHFVVQGQRYYLVSISGCMPTASDTLVTAFCIILPPLILVTINAYFAILIMVRLRLYRTRFESLMQASNTTKSRFFRLFLLSMMFVCVLFPIQLYISFQNWPRRPEIFRWSQVHDYEKWNTIAAISSGGMVSRDRWIQIACGFLIFFFFGLGKEAQEMYSAWARAIGLGVVMDKLIRRRKHVNAHNDSQASFLSKARGRLLSSFLAQDQEKTSTSSLTQATTSDSLELSTMNRIETRFSDATTSDLVQKQGLTVECSGPVVDEPSLKKKEAHGSFVNYLARLSRKKSSVEEAV